MVVPCHTQIASVASVAKPSWSSPIWGLGPNSHVLALSALRAENEGRLQLKRVVLLRTIALDSFAFVPGSWAFWGQSGTASVLWQCPEFHGSEDHKPELESEENRIRPGKFFWTTGQNPFHRSSHKSMKRLWIQPFMCYFRCLLL